MIPAIASSVFLSSGIFLVQLIPFSSAINRTNGGNSAAVVACRSSQVWTKPSWPTDISQYCQLAIDDLTKAEWEVFQNPKPMHDYMRKNGTQEHFDTDPVYLPYKIIAGPCTLALTTLDSIPVGYMPTEIPKPPYAQGGYSSWHDVWIAAKLLYDGCLRDHGQAGMLTTDQVQKPGLGLLLYSTGSQIDRVVGDKVNKFLVSPVGYQPGPNSKTVSKVVTY